MKNSWQYLVIILLGLSVAGMSMGHRESIKRVERQRDDWQNLSKDWEARAVQQAEMTDLAIKTAEKWKATSERFQHEADYCANLYTNFVARMAEKHTESK